MTDPICGRVHPHTGLQCLLSPGHHGQCGQFVRADELSASIKMGRQEITNAQEHEARVREQWEKFQAALPEFLRGGLLGKWVVYLDGVQYIGDSEHDARRVALRYYDRDTGYVIAPIVPSVPIPSHQLGGLGATAVHEQQYAELQAENAKLRAKICELAEDKAGMAETIEQLESELKALDVVIDKARWFCEPRTAIRALLAINRAAFDDLLAALDELET